MATAARKNLRPADRPADDEPFDFNLDAVQIESDVRPFRIHHGGRRWEMKHQQEINIFDLLFEEDTEQQAALRIFEAALGDQWGEFRKIPLPVGKVDDLFTAYQKHCGIDVGESSASDSS